ncbi:phytoene desaturase family protein [Senegalia massiliensis]|uniref:phytoene desaturase family protein n=1 Tax=Senegalia massiliensis TaxID=1720316 RepID=UPI001030680C|nr:phytoene desaturase family protein [Senegalia massiliensis]
MKNNKVLVIGSGLGGLSTAISLASEGYDVEIFEKNNKIGGKLNLLEKEGFKFDLGPSIFTMPHIFNELFENAGKNMDDYFRLIPVKPHWRNFFEDNKVIDLVPVTMKNKFRVNGVSEKDKRDLEDFLTYSKKLYDLVDEGYFSKGLDTFKDNIKEYGFIKLLKDLDGLSTVDSQVKKYIDNNYLRDIINFFVKYVGSSPYNAPALLNLLPYIQYQFGLWYVEGGMYNLAKGLSELIDDLNIKVYLNSEVKKILTKNGHAYGIKLHNDKEVNANIIVSNMEIIPAYKKLLNENDEFIKKYDKFEPSCSGLVIHLGLKKVYKNLAHHNFFFSKDPKEHFSTVFDNKELPNDPTIYLVAPTRTDRTQAPEGFDNIKILPHIPYIKEGITEKKYFELKEKIYDKLERMGLDKLRDNILFEEILTPFDIESMYYSNKGSIYGVVSDVKKNLGLKAAKKSEKYEGLYFVGGSVNPGGGMPMAILSGINVKNLILETNI